MVINKKKERKEIQKYFQEVLVRRGISKSTDEQVEQKKDAENFSREEVTAESGGFYDFDLSEFPLFSLQKKSPGTKKRQPLIYEDKIRGFDSKEITRTWTVYPGPFGFGGATTHLLCFELIQLYCDQGAKASRIQFGTLRNLLMKRGKRNPSKRDYDRIRRDLDILRGYDFHAKNAYYDPKRKSYVDMKWRLFGDVFFFKPTPEDTDQEHPFGFIEVSPTLQEIARSRGFFSVGFNNELFYQLKPMEQRLAVYLAKKFISQRTHKRYLDDLVKALPIESATENDARKSLRKSALGLIEAKVPIIAGFRFEKSVTGRGLAVFERKAIPKQANRVQQDFEKSQSPEIRNQVERITEAVGSSNDAVWWTQCVKRLGTGAVDRALGLLKESRQNQEIKSPGGLLTHFFQKIAEEEKVSLS